jgi:hypothetical protein
MEKIKIYAIAFRANTNPQSRGVMLLIEDERVFIEADSYGQFMEMQLPENLAFGGYITPEVQVSSAELREIISSARHIVRYAIWMQLRAWPLLTH